MKKIIKNPIFTFVLCALIFGGIVGVSAYTIFANDIGYTPKDITWKKSNGEDITNVKDAIDELYNKSSDYNLKLSGLEELNLDNITLVENKEIKLLNSQSGTVTYDNLNSGNYLLYTFRTTTVSDGGVYYAQSASRYESAKRGIPTVTVNNGTIAKISDEVYVITITNNSSTITINSNNTGASTTTGGCIYSGLYLIN